jgi:hypothetical protein
MTEAGSGDPRTPPPPPKGGSVFDRRRGVSFPPATTDYTIALMPPAIRSMSAFVRRVRASTTVLPSHLRHNGARPLAHRADRRVSRSIAAEEAPGTRGSRVAQGHEVEDPALAVDQPAQGPETLLAVDVQRSAVAHWRADARPTSAREVALFGSYLVSCARRWSGRRDWAHLRPVGHKGHNGRCAAGLQEFPGRFCRPSRADFVSRLDGHHARRHTATVPVCGDACSGRLVTGRLACRSARRCRCIET